MAKFMFGPVSPLLLEALAALHGCQLEMMSFNYPYVNEHKYMNQLHSANFPLVAV